MVDLLVGTMVDLLVGTKACRVVVVTALEMVYWTVVLWGPIMAVEKAQKKVDKWDYE